MAINTTFLENSSEDNNLSTNPIGYFVPVSVNGNTVTIKDKSSTTKTLTYDTLNNQLIEDSSGEIFVALKESLNSYYEISDITINGEEWDISMVVDKLDTPTDHEYTHLLLFISDLIESEVNVDSVVGYVVNDERFKYGNNVSFSNTLINYDNSYPYLIIELNTNISFTKELNYEFDYNVKMTEDSDVSVVHASDQRESSIKEFTELYTYNALNDIWLYMNKFIKDTQYNVNSTTISESSGTSIYEDGVLVSGQASPNGISFNFYSNIYTEDNVQIIYKEETIFDSFNNNRFETKIDEEFLFSFNKNLLLNENPYLSIKASSGDDKDRITIAGYNNRDSYGVLTDSDLINLEIKFGYTSNKSASISSVFTDDKDGILINGISSMILNNYGTDDKKVAEIYYNTDGILINTKDSYSNIFDTSLNLGYDGGFNTITSSSDGLLIEGDFTISGTTNIAHNSDLAFQSSGSGYVSLDIGGSTYGLSIHHHYNDTENDSNISMYYDSGTFDYNNITSSSDGIAFDCKISASDPIYDQDVLTKAYFNKAITINSTPNYLTFHRDVYTDYELKFGVPGSSVSLELDTYSGNKKTLLIDSSITIPKEATSNESKSIRFKYNEWDGTAEVEKQGYLFVTGSEEDISDPTTPKSAGVLQYGRDVDGTSNSVAFKSDTGTFTFTTADGKSITVNDGIIISYSG